MKRLKKWMCVLFGVMLLTASYTEVKAHHKGWHGKGYGYRPVNVSFSVFYDNLSPYGEWISDPYYGYVWVPDVAPGFRPYYTNGYWVNTEYGNTWVSSYSWGWAPFHYGRWTYDPYYGWVWIPDNVWGPAWVCWRSGGGYYGWAPLSPGFNFSVGFGSYYAPNDWWVFVPPTYVYHHDFHRYYSGPRNNTTIINNTTVVNNTYVYNNNTYVTGPTRTEYERTTNQRVPVYAIKNEAAPGTAKMGKSEVSMYRPQVDAKSNSKNVAPAKVTNVDRKVTSKPQAMGSGNPERKVNPSQRGVDVKQQPNSENRGRTNLQEQPVDRKVMPNQRTQPQNMEERRQNMQPENRGKPNVTTPDNRTTPDRIQTQPNQRTVPQNEQRKQDRVVPDRNQQQPRQVQPQQPDRRGNEQPNMQRRVDPNYEPAERREVQPQRVDPQQRGNQQREPVQRVEPQQQPQRLDMQQQPQRMEPQQQPQRMQPQQQPQRMQPQHQPQRIPVNPGRKGG